MSYYSGKLVLNRSIPALLWLLQHFVVYTPFQPPMGVSQGEENNNDIYCPPENKKISPVIRHLGCA